MEFFDVVFTLYLGLFTWLLLIIKKSSESQVRCSRMIMRRMNIRGLLLLLTLIPFYVPDLSAQSQETLRGLKAFAVTVDLHDDKS